MLRRSHALVIAVVAGVLLWLYTRDDDWSESAVFRGPPPREDSARIFIGVMSGKTTALYRARVLYETLATFNTSATIVFFTEQSVPELGHHVPIYPIEECADNQQNGLCCKTLQSYLVTATLYHDHDWFVHITDDSFVHTDNLITILDSLDPTEPWFLGDLKIHPQFLYVDGGSGWVLSRAALLQVASQDGIDRLRATYDVKSCYDDTYFGIYMAAMEIAPSHLLGAYAGAFEIHNCPSAPCGPTAYVTLGPERMDLTADQVASPDASIVLLHMQFGPQAGGQPAVSDASTYPRLLSAIDSMTRSERWRQTIAG